MKRWGLAQREADTWNFFHDIGTAVDYWTMELKGAPSGTSHTRSRAEVVGHFAVVWVEGLRGWVALSHVKPITRTRLISFVLGDLYNALAVSAFPNPGKDGGKWL